MSRDGLCRYGTVFEDTVIDCGQNCCRNSDYCIMHKRKLDEIDGLMFDVVKEITDKNNERS